MKTIGPYAKALKLVPGYPEAALQWAVLDREAGRVLAAETRLLALVAANPWSHQGYRQLAKLFNAVGDRAKEVDALDRVLKHSPRERAVDVYDRGMAHGALKHPDQALADLQRAVELDRRSVFDHVFHLGMAYRFHKRLVEAKSMLGRAVKLRAKDFYARYYLGETKSNLGAFETAVGDFSRALDLTTDPSRLAIAHLQRGWAQQALGKSQPAIDDYRRYLELAPKGKSAADARSRIRELAETR